MGTRKVGPAIAAGCTMVVKPAKQTPLSMLALAQILEEAGLPGGVLNVITAKSSGVGHGAAHQGPADAQAVASPARPRSARSSSSRRAEQVLRVSMELGGNAPFLVFEDADLDAAVEGAMVAKMRNIGEACTAPTASTSPSRSPSEFAEKLAARMGALKVGRGTRATASQVGPLIDDDQRGKVAELVEDAAAQGREGRSSAASALDGAGYFYAPTVARRRARRAPGCCARRSSARSRRSRASRSEDEAIAAANDTEYGLVAYVYTRDLERAFRVIERLETGMVGLNQGMVSNAGAPFGGVKQSGFGREGGPEGIDEYLETKYVAMNV